MSEEIAVYQEEGHDLAVNRPPQQVLAEAQKAAIALAEVIRKKKKPFILNGEQYLEFEDWQTVGRFYGITAKVVSTEYIEFDGGKGFQAKAAAIKTIDGVEVSAAEAMCLNDEPNWRNKPLFQLRSMAQTRACAKALRNVLAWVVVLAGYKPTPAEEMAGVAQVAQSGKPIVAPPQAKITTETKTTMPHGGAVVDLLNISGEITEMKKKEGKAKNGEAYIRYSLIVAGLPLSTFNEKIADDAKAAMEIGMAVDVEYVQAGNYNNVKTLTVSATQGDREPGEEG